jgi:6-phosphofructokinase 1
MPTLLPLNHDDPGLLSFLKNVGPFRRLSVQEIEALATLLSRKEYQPGEYIFKAGDMGDTIFIIEEGLCCLEVAGRTVKHMMAGDLFGEIAVIDTLPRTASVRADQRCLLLCLNPEDLDNENKFTPSSHLKLLKELARQITSYVRSGDALYQEMDCLLVQDGGCAPGYDSVTAFLTYYLEETGRQVFMAREGFKSLVSGQSKDFCCLINSRDLYSKLENMAGVIYTPPMREARGASFRTERYPEFAKPENQQIATKTLMSRKVRVLIGIGGNGTFSGINALSRLLPESTQIFFIPVTIDSDIFGTECIGEHTGVQIGSEKILSYLADARTHHRIYIIEMMGAEGGYHALNSCLGAGADLAVLPSSRYNMLNVATALNKRESAVIVVAEGYKRAERKESGLRGNAAEFFRDELQKAGLGSERRVVCEGFSRDIRGAAPNYRDITLSQRMARHLVRLLYQGANRVMPAILGSQEYAIPFNEIRTDNSVESGLADLASILITTVEITS